MNRKEFIMGFIIFLLLFIGAITWCAKQGDPTMSNKDLGYGILGLIIIIAILSGGVLMIVGFGVIAWILKLMGKATN